MLFVIFLVLRFTLIHVLDDLVAPNVLNFGLSHGLFCEPLNTLWLTKNRWTLARWMKVDRSCKWIRMNRRVLVLESILSKECEGKKSWNSWKRETTNNSSEESREAWEILEYNTVHSIIDVEYETTFAESRVILCNPVQCYTIYCFWKNKHKHN